MQLPLPTGFFVQILPQCNAPLYEFDSVSDSVESEAEGKGSQDATQTGMRQGQKQTLFQKVGNRED